MTRNFGYKDQLDALSWETLTKLKHDVNMAYSRDVIFCHFRLIDGKNRIDV